MMNPICFTNFMTLALFFFCTISQAALTPDRTRIIFNGDQNSVSLNVNNANKTLPFLAQAWLEDINHKKVTSPLIVIPPIQRINGGERSLVRITRSQLAAQLPQDRESLFYFNLREIPPRSDKANVLQIALQSQMKLFYRPVSIIAEKNAVWQERLIINKTETGIIIKNPTPYHITLSSLKLRSQKLGGGHIRGFESVMIAPQSQLSVTLSDRLPNRFVMTYINDYGGQPELMFSCAKDNVCLPDTLKK
ncbi:fimbrial biogenesis chaperone [Pantoea sp. y20]